MTASTIQIFVKEGMAEVERGEIASHEEVVEKFRKWGVNAA